MLFKILMVDCIVFIMDYFCFCGQFMHFRSLSRAKLKEWNMSSIECDSRDDAVKIIKSISRLPKKYFIKCHFPCVVGGSVCIAVEEYRKTFSYPTKDHAKNAIRYLLLIPLKRRNYYYLFL